MTHPIYNEQSLTAKTLTELKSLYTAIGCTRQVADKRSKDSWITAIIRFQEEQAVKISKVRTIALGNSCFNMTLAMTSLYLHPTTDEIGALETTVELNTGGMNYEVLATCANPEEAKDWATAYLEGQNPQAPKTCSDCPQFDSERGCCKLFNMVAKPYWQMTNDCVSEMEAQAECVKNEDNNINIPAEQPQSPAAQQTFIDANHETAVEAGFTFTQEQRGESLFWCGRLNKFHTGYFPELSTAAKFAVKYLSSPLYKRHQQEALNPPIDTSKCPSARDEAFDLDDEETAFVQSGDITFKEVTSTTYNVFNKGLQIGVVTLNQGHWAIGINNERYATPYLAAAALVEFQLKLELLDKPVSELTRTEWTGLKQTVSAEVEGQIEELLEECEVDGNPDNEFGTLYRLWNGMKLLGTFYRPVFSDKWLARPSSGNSVFDADSEECARYWLVYAHITGDCSGDKSVKQSLEVVAA